MKIKEFAKLCNCKTSLLRYYDEIDLLKPEAVNKETGYREYSPSQKEKYDYICTLKNSGFSIEEIKSVEANPDELGNKIEQKINELRTILNHINRFRYDFSELEKKIDDFLSQYSTEAKEYGLYECLKISSDQIKDGSIYNYGPDDDPEITKKWIESTIRSFSRVFESNKKQMLHNV